MKNNFKTNYGPEKIPVVRNVRENNIVFEENRSKNLPYFAIRKWKKWYYIEYDFISCDYQLKEEAKHEVERLVIELANKSKRYNGPVVWGMGYIVGISPKCQLKTCKEYAPKIRDIIFNMDNLELSDSGKLNQAIENGDLGAYLRYEMEINKRRIIERKKLNEGIEKSQGNGVNVEHKEKIEK